jgi:3-deoxy-D-manno-octulosonic-acid transferase
MPIFFGNKAYHKFQEAVDLVKQGGAYAVALTNDLSEILKDLRSNEAKKKETDTISQNYVLQNIGATEKVMHVVESILND